MTNKKMYIYVIIAILLIFSVYYLSNSYDNKDKIENGGPRRNPLINDVEGSNPSKNKPWPMYQHDLQHTGYSSKPGEGEISNYIPLWHSTNQGGHSAIADFNDDGTQDVVLITDTGRDNTVHLFSGDGEELWKYYSSSDMWHTPAIADVNNDNKLELLVPLRLGKALIALTSEGESLWGFNTNGRVQNSPAVADINSDGKLEIIFGDSSLKEDDPSHLYAIISEGITPKEIWRYATPSGGYITNSFPAISDLNNDNKLEIIIGVHGPGGILNPDYSYLAALNCKGEEIWRYDVDTDLGVPTIGDLDNDGDLEILFSEFGEDNQGTLFCLDDKGKRVWDFSLAGGGSMVSPSIGDFDSDGKLEIIVSCEGNSEIYMLDSNGNMKWKYPFYSTSGQIESCSAISIADLDNDTNLEIIGGYYYIDPNANSGENIKKGGIFILNDQGKKIWGYDFIDPQAPHPIIADLNNDGTLEIIVNTDGNPVEFGSNDDPPYYTYYTWYSPSEGIWVFGDSSQSNLIDQLPNFFVENSNVFAVKEDVAHIKIVVAVYNLGHLGGSHDIIMEVWTNQNLTLIEEVRIDLSQPVTWKKIEVEYTAIYDIPTTIWIKIDPNNSILESNENDNNAFTST